MRTFKEIVGDRIRRQREIAGYSTQSKLADKMNISASRVSDWETGKAVPNAEYKKMLCALLKASESELFGIDGVSGTRLTPDEIASLLEPIFNLTKLDAKLRPLALTILTGKSPAEPAEEHDFKEDEIELLSRYREGDDVAKEFILGLAEHLVPRRNSSARSK